MKLDELEARLGPATRRKLFEDDDDPNPSMLITWKIPVEPGRSELYLQWKKKGLSITLWIPKAITLTSRHGVPAKPIVGLFVAWALSRGLLDESRFAEHRDLVDRIRRREAKGSALVDAALSRGLWDNHFVANDDVRQTARRWLHCTGGLSYTDDLVGVFGERTNQYSHREPVLDDDSWESVDRAARVLDERFAAFVPK